MDHAGPVCELEGSPHSSQDTDELPGRDGGTGRQDFPQSATGHPFRLDHDGGVGDGRHAPYAGDVRVVQPGRVVDRVHDFGRGRFAAILGQGNDP